MVHHFAIVFGEQTKKISTSTRLVSEACRSIEDAFKISLESDAYKLKYYDADTSTYIDVDVSDVVLSEEVVKIQVAKSKYSLTVITLHRILN